MKTIHTGYCCLYELAKANQPTIFNRLFWQGDGSPCVPVKLVVSKANHRRVFDLVRYMRSDLHAANLITEDEYAWLCTYEFKEDKGKPGSPSPRRLEDYDSLRAQLAALQVAAKKDGELLGEIGTVLKERAVGHAILYSDRVTGFIKRIDAARERKGEGRI